MTALEFLKQFPNHADFSRKSKLLLFAFFLRRHKAQVEFGSKDLRDCFDGAMLRVPSDLSSLLKTLSTGRDSPFIRSKTKGRYSISIHGQAEVERTFPGGDESPERLSTFLSAAVPYLRRTIAKVEDEARREFLAEAISCLGVQARRATIVMTWIATMDHLQQYVIAKKLAEFNIALSNRSDKLSKLTVTSQDDLGDIKESVLIEICRSAKIITNDVRKILDERLGTRNSCAHPASIQISDSKVVSYIEDLVENVISKYEV